LGANLYTDYKLDMALRCLLLWQKYGRFHPKIKGLFNHDQRIALKNIHGVGIQFNCQEGD